MLKLWQKNSTGNQIQPVEFSCRRIYTFLPAMQPAGRVADS